jgi:hypothetical protein
MVVPAGRRLGSQGTEMRIAVKKTRCPGVFEVDEMNDRMGAGEGAPES